MPSERDTRIEQICHEALERDGSTRRAFLDDACAGDGALRRDVESLLAHAGGADEFLRRPALDVAAQHVAVPHQALATGQHIGSFTIVGPIGVGGMGEVYRARDPKLGRDVAIKVLPAMFTVDADRLARFEREARTLAALNHPHIGAIYGLEESDGVLALVLELVEGPTLAERIQGEGATLRFGVPPLGGMELATDAGPEFGCNPFHHRLQKERPPKGGTPNV